MSTPDRSRELGYTAFILSLLIVIPILPLVGAVLGMIGAAAPRGKPGRRLAIAAIPTGLVMTALLLSIGLPAFVHYLWRSNMCEPTEGLDKIREGIARHAKLRGSSSLPPLGDTGWTPLRSCCQSPGPKCAPNPTLWANPLWGMLDFQMTNYHYYQWRYRGHADRFIVEARGDLDCDGVMGHYRMVGTVDHHGNLKTNTIVTNRYE